MEGYSPTLTEACEQHRNHHSEGFFVAFRVSGEEGLDTVWYRWWIVNRRRENRIIWLSFLTRRILLKVEKAKNKWLTG